MGLHTAMAAKGMAAINADLGEGWVDTFDLDALDMQNPWRCVLGQAYNKPGVMLSGYSLGLDRLCGQDASYSKRRMFAQIHGFASETAAGYRYLDAAWRKLISEAKARR